LKVDLGDGSHLGASRESTQRQKINWRKAFFLMVKGTASSFPEVNHRAKELSAPLAEALAHHLVPSVTVGAVL
jgi:hypothetical protein